MHSRSSALRLAALALLVSVAAGASRLRAQDTLVKRIASDSARTQALETVKVHGRIDNLIGIAGSASEGRVGAVDLRLRPITREAELLEAIPGVIVTQHSGEGKANQYFVRGFNLDHGTDFQTRVDGMPINLPTHAHGQGYTDLNFLVPELVDYLDYKLGVYHAELGDFGSAGGAEFHLLRKLDRPFITAASGANGLARLAGGASTRLAGGDFLLGGEAHTYDGPWLRAEKIRKLSGMARYTYSRNATQWSLLGLAYKNRWNSNDQIPLRAVERGLISRFGQIDSTVGGNTQRYSLSGSMRRVSGRAIQDIQIYGIYSDLDLVSDFTYFLNDAAGDQFAQRDQRIVLGGSAKHIQTLTAFNVPNTLTVGVQSRTDIINGVGLYNSVRSIRTNTVRQDDVRETGTGVFVQAESKWTPWFRSVLGARADVYAFSVSSELAENSGHRNAGIVSPKASFIFAPNATTEVYLSGGYGFHSNDARGTTITVDPVTRDAASRVDPLVRSRGAEVGLRATPVSGLRTTVTVWALNLDSELLFVGDGGTTEPSAGSKRQGVTLANFYRPIPRLSLDADVSFAHARFHGVEVGQTHVPGALESVFAGGIAWSPLRQGLFASARVRRFGSYALTEDNSVRSTATSLLSADAGYQLHNGIRVQFTALNLLDARASDIQYYYASRLRGEPTSGVEDIHFHPIEPRQIRVSLGWGF